MEQPQIRASITRTVTVGVELRRRLEETARPQGADASYLARQILRAHLDTHNPPPRAEPEDE